MDQEIRKQDCHLSQLGWLGWHLGGFELLLYPHKIARNQKGDSKAIEKLLEMVPTQTYKWKEGVATSAEMAGKGERRNKSVQDLIRFSKMRKGDAIPLDAETVDTSSLSQDERKRVSDRIRQMGHHALDDNPSLSDAEEYGSESDSDVDLD